MVSPLPTFLPTQSSDLYDFCGIRRSSQSRKSLKSLVMVDSHGGSPAVVPVLEMQTYRCWHANLFSDPAPQAELPCLL
jgi:hypothetical protein